MMNYRRLGHYQKIIGMLRAKYQDWLSEVGGAYPDYLTDGGQKDAGQAEHVGSMG